MSTQSCKTCDYFTPDAPDVTVGWCCWATRHPVPSCYYQAEAETWAGAGEVCPCWRVKGYIDDFLAAARARRTQENHQLEIATDKARASATRLGHVIAEYESFIRARRTQETP